MPGEACPLWLIPSSTSTSTPSTRCSTARPGSATSSAAAVADGQPAMGITDHGNMYGVLRLLQGVSDQGVKPIIGTEAYMAHEHRSSGRRGAVPAWTTPAARSRAGKKLYYHLTLLAENNTGYKNLIQLASRAFLEGYYYKPRSRLGAARRASRGA